MNFETTIETGNISTLHIAGKILGNAHRYFSQGNGTATSNGAR